jgi:hypothetical protein
MNFWQVQILNMQLRTDKFCWLIKKLKRPYFCNKNKLTEKSPDQIMLHYLEFRLLLKGTTIDTLSDNIGNYSLSNIPENATLQISFVGMHMKEVKVENQTTVDVGLASGA